MKMLKIEVGACLGALAATLMTCASHAQPLVISGNEGKIDLTPGAAQIIPNAPPDTISILDFASFPPEVTHLTNVPNTVIGPPSNIAITPGGKMALIANSIKADAADPAGFSPHNEIHLLDLTTTPPRITGKVRAGQQPSGMSITPDGEFALVANRAGGTISVLGIKGKEVRHLEEVKVCEPMESISDVAISPDGSLVLASAQKGGYLAVLTLEEGKLTPTGRKISVYGQPYRCIITPDGELGITAGQGFGNGLDPDLVTVIDLKSDPIRTTDFLKISTGPETLEISPNGKLLAVLTMNGSNLAPDNPNRTPSGGLELFERKGRGFVKQKVIPTGAIPEGLAFTGDGKHLVVQCHPARELWIYKVENDTVSGEPLRISVPGMPSSLRATR